MDDAGAGTSIAAKQFTGEDLGPGEQSYSSFEQLMINQLNNMNPIKGLIMSIVKHISKT